MALVWIRVFPTGKGRHVQLTPEVRHRSVDGDTLLLIPGMSREITQDEWQFVQSAHPDLLDDIERLDNGPSGSSADNGEAPHQPGQWGNPLSGRPASDR